jgi:hypothetical protein
VLGKIVINTPVEDPPETYQKKAQADTREYAMDAERYGSGKI